MDSRRSVYTVVAGFTACIAVLPDFRVVMVAVDLTCCSGESLPLPPH